MVAGRRMINLNLFCYYHVLIEFDMLEMQNNQMLITLVLIFKVDHIDKLIYVR